MHRLQVFLSYLDFPLMNPMLDLLRIPGKKGFSTTKLAVLLAGVLFAGTLAWLAVPYIFFLLASVLPRLWTSVRSSTAPPYLFIAVNFIILTIWKLSGNRSLYTDRHPEDESSSNPTPISLKPRDLVSSLPLQFQRRTSPETLQKAPSITEAPGEKPSPMQASESSCITTESEERSTASSSPSSGLVTQESALTAMDPAGEEEMVVDDGGERDSLDDTWNAIMRKTGRCEKSSPPTAAGKQTVRASPEAAIGGSEGKDEMNQRFDDFIKKNYDQIRLRKPGEKNQQWQIN